MHRSSYSGFVASYDIRRNTTPHHTGNFTFSLYLIFFFHFYFLTLVVKQNLKTKLNLPLCFPEVKITVPLSTIKKGFAAEKLLLPWAQRGVQVLCVVCFWPVSFHFISSLHLTSLCFEHQQKARTYPLGQIGNYIVNRKIYHI